MGALSEDSAIIASSLSTDLRNNWTKNNAEGIAFFVLFVNLSIKKKTQPTNQNLMLAAVMLRPLDTEGFVSFICGMSWFLHGAFEASVE